MNPIHRQRLLDVARALRESPNPEWFSMARFCPLRFYEARVDLHEGHVEALAYDRWAGYSPLRIDGRCWLEAAPSYFGLNAKEIGDLFTNHGCGDAQTALQAAKYIEAFVAAR